MTTSGKNSNDIKQALFDASHVLLSRPPNGHAACLSVESDGQLSLVVKVFLSLFLMVLVLSYRECCPSAEALEIILKKL